MRLRSRAARRRGGTKLSRTAPRRRGVRRGTPALSLARAVPGAGEVAGRAQYLGALSSRDWGRRPGKRRRSRPGPGSPAERGSRAHGGLPQEKAGRTSVRAGGRSSEAVPGLRPRSKGPGGSGSAPPAEALQAGGWLQLKEKEPGTPRSPVPPGTSEGLLFKNAESFFHFSYFCHLARQALTNRTL